MPEHGTGASRNEESPGPKSLTHALPPPAKGTISHWPKGHHGRFQEAGPDLHRTIGERQYGYGGYSYDGRWLPIAKDIAAHYRLKPGGRILDVGCGKAFLLYEFTQAVPGIEVAGIDISEYGIEHAREEIKPFLQIGDCVELPYEDDSFDFVYSINTFHNLEIFDLEKAVREAERVSRDKAWICVESYRNEREKANLLYWQLTCMSFRNTAE